MRFHSDPDRFRGTGRTTEMLQKALYSAKHGHNVIVFMFRANEIYYAKAIACDLLKEKLPDNIKFFDLSQATCHKLQPFPDNGIVYFDHRAKEKMTYEQYQVLCMRRYIK